MRTIPISSAWSIYNKNIFLDLTMSDDIDIEEHDLLDDPVIKNIFPDLSKLKQEILGYDEEGMTLHVYRKI